MISDTPNQSRTLRNQHFQFFSSFWQILVNFGKFWVFFFVAKIEEEKKVMKNIYFFQKLFDVCGTVTKYELRTPPELGAIRILAKIIFFRKKMISVNSLI